MDLKTALTFSAFKRISTLLPMAAVVVTPRGKEDRAIRGRTLAKKEVICVVAMVLIAFTTGSVGQSTKVLESNAISETVL
eukprot:scaffold4707_cov164-Amphora_coffeaeformis.AAC.24